MRGNLLKSFIGVGAAVAIMSTVSARPASREPEIAAPRLTAAEIAELASEMQELYGIEPEPETVLAEEAPAKPSAEQLERLRVIGRMAEGIRKVARNKGGGKWWECGRVYAEDEEADAAIEWSHRIVTLAWEYSDRGSETGFQINPWEVAGVAANECGFDRCALGKWPRKWGYENGTMKRSRYSISHSYEEIHATLTSEKAGDRWKKVGLDGAPLHVLWRCEGEKCWPKFNREGLPPIPMEEVFSLGMGFEYNVREMKKRAIDNRTSRPSAYWKGYLCDWYDEKIRNWEKRLGARPEEV